MKYLTAIICAVLLVGCGGPKTGTVKAKEYEKPYSYVTMDCYMYNTNGTCRLTMPNTHNVPEQYKLQLRNGDDIGWISVDARTYHNTNIGDSYGSN